MMDQYGVEDTNAHQSELEVVVATAAVATAAVATAAGVARAVVLGVATAMKLRTKQTSAHRLRR